MQFKFNFKLPDDGEVGPQQRLGCWSRRYPPKYDEPVYTYLVGKADQLSESDFHILGAWKDGALKKSGLGASAFGPSNVSFNGKWSPEAASTAYDVWLQAAKELPGRMTGGYPPDIGSFLTQWSERRGRSGTRTKCFGLSGATTLLHFITGGNYPIFDSRVRQAIQRLTGVKPLNSLAWYLNEYCPLFRRLAEQCEVEADPRKLDKALFAYGGKS